MISRKLMVTSKIFSLGMILVTPDLLICEPSYDTEVQLSFQYNGDGHEFLDPFLDTCTWSRLSTMNEAL